MSAQKGKPRSPEGSRRIYENFFLSQTIHAEAQLAPTQEPAAFPQDPCPAGDSHSANARSMCLARGVHGANLTSLVQNHGQDANFLCGAYD